MSSENTITGRNGKFQVGGSLVARTTQWSLSRKAGESAWGDSDSAGYTNRAGGRKDATFNAEGKYQTNDSVFALFDIDDIADVTLWLDNSSLYFQFPRALCTGFDMAVNIDTEEVVGWTSSWGADGAFYYPGQADAPEKSLPEG